VTSDGKLKKKSDLGNMASKMQEPEPDEVEAPNDLTVASKMQEPEPDEVEAPNDLTATTTNTPAQEMYAYFRSQNNMNPTPQEKQNWRYQRIRTRRKQEKQQKRTQPTRGGGKRRRRRTKKYRR
jgi:hypothetical protein